MNQPLEFDRRDRLTNEDVQNLKAGPQGSISSRYTTVADWLARNSFDTNRFGNPIGFGCDICTTLSFETLEGATEHCQSENTTVRSRHWKHAVTLRCERRGYVAHARDIIQASQAQQSKPPETRGIIDGKINMELSDHVDEKHPKCPRCQGALVPVGRANTRVDRDGDTEIVSWNVKCLGCGTEGVLHND